MISKYIKGKVYVFIDAANTFYAQQTLGWRISYEKLMKYFKKECGESVKCFIYVAYDENKESERKFLDMLDINGYILRIMSTRGRVSRELLERAKFIDLRKLKGEISQ